MFDNLFDDFCLRKFRKLGVSIKFAVFRTDVDEKCIGISRTLKGNFDKFLIIDKFYFWTVFFYTSSRFVSSEVYYVSKINHTSALLRTSAAPGFLTLSPAPAQAWTRTSTRSPSLGAQAAAPRRAKIPRSRCSAASPLAKKLSNRCQNQY